MRQPVMAKVFESVLPLWLTLDLCVPVQLEESYMTTCRSLRIPA